MIDITNTKTGIEYLKKVKKIILNKDINLEYITSINICVKPKDDLKYIVIKSGILKMIFVFDEKENLKLAFRSSYEDFTYLVNKFLKEDNNYV